jgi:hypothetical protein
MMKVLLLVCAAATPRLDCQESTARVVIQGPDAANAITCAMRSQAYFAGTAIEIDAAEYLKIKCVRTGIGRNNVG